jgi:hypothetical protein
MLQTRIVKTGTNDIERTEIVPEEMVHMSWKMVNLEKTARSIRLLLLPRLSVLTAPCHVPHFFFLLASSIQFNNILSPIINEFSSKYSGIFSLISTFLR